MSKEIRNLQPQEVWNCFADLNAVPRPSKKEERVIQFAKEFGENLGLDTTVDATGNVIIKKPATAGMESKKTVVLQGHLDMVHQKNNDTDFDFSTEGIKMYVDGDWVRAQGTTLGADNGLGVAAIMAILKSDDIAHPALEALFTIDEETGMTGAKHLDETVLSGEILLNLDTEEDDEIGIGCAGGVDVTATRSYDLETAPADAKAYAITVKGLNGGHSGMDIIKGLGNANKLMNRLLYTAQKEASLQIISVSGGGLRNAIPRESSAEVVTTNPKAFEQAIQVTAEAIKKEYATLEANLEISCTATTSDKKVASVADTRQLLNTVYTAHNGVYRMSPDIEDLVETSNNIARVDVGEGRMEVQCLTRSSVESGKWDLANALTAAFELGGFSVKTSGEYPGWKPNPDSEILKLVDELYQKQNGERANVAACHAGLECGILLSHYPKMDMVSFGPTIRGAHSPDERASISSTQKFWKFLLEVLKEIPERA